MRIANVVLASLVLTASACGVFGSGDEPPPPPEPPLNPPARPGEQADTPPPPPPLTGTPTENELTEEHGVFVAAAGTADGDGTRAKPLSSIQAGIDRAKATSKRVYVCGETFAEALTLARGIPMVGGLDCSSVVWKKGSTRTRIESPSSPAIEAIGIDIPTRVEGFEVVAPDATAAAPTSIGLRAKGSGGLAIVASTITAGRGFAGAAGADGVQLTFSQVPAGPGASDWILGELPRPQNVGGAGAIGSCVGAPGFAGGNGGKGGTGSGTLSDGCRSPLQCALGAIWWFDERWVNYDGDNEVDEGERLPAAPNKPPEDGSGSAAIAGTDGLSAASPGTFSADGFHPADGASGTNGTPGKGGAGGAGGTPFRQPTKKDLEGQGASGPGGGAGGCPGLAGTAGKGGGASIGALVSDSAGITFDAVEIVAAEGGNGGRGSLGSNATAGGPPAAPHPGAGNGAAGEPGGRAGVSGSGAGGSSVAIAHHGGAPSLVNGSILKPGNPGKGVPQEQATDPATGQTKTIAASADGLAKDLVEF